MLSCSWSFKRLCMYRGMYEKENYALKSNCYACVYMFYVTKSISIRIRMDTHIKKNTNIFQKKKQIDLIHYY